MHRDHTDASASHDNSSIDQQSRERFGKIVEPQRYADAYIVDTGMRFVAAPTEWLESDRLLEVRR